MPPEFLSGVDYRALLAAHCGLLAVVLAAALARKRWLRPPAAVAAAAALWLPLFALIETLGQPNPYPPDGRYRVLSSTLDKDAGRLYLFVDTLGADPTPRVYAIPFDPGEYERFEAQAADYEQQVLEIVSGEGEYEVVYVDYEPPDLLKDGLMRGWQEPREDD